MARSIVSCSVASRRIPSRRIATQTAASGQGAFIPVVANYGPGSFSFAVTQTGNYRFAHWGAGGGGTAGGVGGGGGGELVQSVRFLISGQTVTGSVAPETAADTNGANTTVTLPSGEVIIAHGGFSGTNGGIGGTGGNGDINTPGLNKSGATGGAGATYGNYHGGPATGVGIAPGGAGNDTGGSGTKGGAGLLLISRES